MTFEPLSRADPDFLNRRIREFRRDLGELAERVRRVVVEAIRETLANLARDAVDRFMWRRLAPQPLPTPVRSQREDFDPWDAESDPDYEYEAKWDEDEEPQTPVSRVDPKPLRVPNALVIGLAAAGWWLRRGKLLGAMTVALVTGVAAAFTGRLPCDVAGLVQAAGDLLSFHRFLSTFGLA
jgi:hypothetical protein